MKYINLQKIMYMDYLMQHKSTGNPCTFAKKIKLSRSALFEHLAYMRNELELGIRYNGYSETYYYDGKDLCSVLGNMRCTICQVKSLDKL